MAAETPQSLTSRDLPFGAGATPAHKSTRERPTDDPSGDSHGNHSGGQGKTSRKDWRRQENRRGSARRGGRRRSRGRAQDEGSAARNGTEAAEAPRAAAGPGPEARARDGDGARFESGDGEQVRASGAVAGTEHAPPRGRRRRKGRRARGGEPGRPGAAVDPSAAQGSAAPRARTEVQGMFVLEKGGQGALRRAENQFLPRKDDVHVPAQLAQRLKLREGALVAGFAGRGHGKYKSALVEVTTVDGKPPKEVADLPVFKKLTSIDPDFHYALGNATEDVNMRIVDLICPVGRGTRGLIVAPPRSGKTILLQKFAKGIEEHYPDVHLFVLLVDERPEEATEWRRSIQGQVFVSTNDESPKNHVQLAEAVWKRCQRLVELGDDVVLLLDSITRLARAYNNFQAGSGRTMSGGLDTRTMEKPKQFFGCARNTETAGSLTILGTTLVETGSRMDQVIFEEFKGTGNMELVLSRKLADRRIFPAIDLERSGTRKEEKLISSKQLKRVHTLRRVLAKMNFIEAMELLITKLEDVATNEDFLKRFDVDPEA